MGVDLATYRARIGCFQNPTPRSIRCWSQASALLVGVILAQLWNKVMGEGRGEVVSSPLDGVLPAVHQTGVQTYQLHSHPQSSCCSVMMSCLLIWFIMALKLLLQAGDIEQNPGPTLRETDTDETEEQSLKTRQNEDGLIEIYLSGRKMSSIPNQIFQQNGIQVLNLQHNNIKVIPMDLGMLFQLKHLDISLNKLSHLPDSISSLSNLEELKISGNTIQEFPKEMENMQSLKVLVYRNNSLVTIPEQVFSLPCLQELDVSDNELSEVSPLLGNLLSLKVLNLRWNQSLKYLPQKLCQLSALEELNLSVCDLGCLPDDIGNLNKLKILKLSCNRISSLPASVFQSLANLVELDLCDNSITEIAETVSKLKKLKTLKVADNQLVTLPTSIVELTELQTFDVAYNSVTSLPDNFEDLVKIVNLNLKHNQISLVPFLNHGAFPALQELDLTGNPIQLSEPQLVTDFCGRRVTVYIDHRQYVRIKDGLDELDEMIEGNFVISLSQGYEINATDICEGIIDLSGKGLNTLPQFFDIHDPPIIRLGHNRLEAFPVSGPAVESSELTVLDLHYNMLSALPEDINLLSNLKNLDVSHNKLKTIPPGLYELLSLENFNMSYNSVQDLPPKTFPKLKKLDLSYNMFQTVPDGIFQTRSLIYLNLLGNDIAFLPADIAGLTNLNTLCYDIRRLQRLCHMPSELKNMPWKNIEWSVTVDDTGKPSSVRIKAHFSARPDVEYLQVKTERKEVTEIGLHENIQLQYENEINCNVAWFGDTLRELIMSNCSLQALPEHIFHLSKLTTLDVSNNMLSSLPSKLVCLQNLQVLNLSNCSLTVLPDSIGDLPSLTSLDISKNSIEALPNPIINSLLSLTELNISLNYITDIILPGSMAKLPSLQRLIMFHCGCYKMDFLSELKLLKFLTVDFWQLVSIQQQTSEQLTDSVQIEVVYLDHETCKDKFCEHEEDIHGPSEGVALEDLRQGIVKLHCCDEKLCLTPPRNFTYNGDNIIKMDVSGSNFFDDFTLNIGVIHTLKRLSITNCVDDLRECMYDFPKFICQQSALQELNMSKCSISCVSEEIGLLVNLTHLDLSKNMIEDLPDELCNITSLRWLSLQDNTLSSLPVKIGNLLCLEYLDVSLNCIDSVPNSFKSLNAMNKLKLFHCGCYQLDFLSELKQLTELTVDFWQLVSIKQQTAKQLPDAVHVKVIYLDYGICYNRLHDSKQGGGVKSVSIPLDKLKCGIIQLQGKQDVFISSPSDDFNYSGDIIKMDLSGSRFDELMLEIGCIHTLQELIIANCDIDLPSYGKELPGYLTQLDVSDNHGQLQCIGQQSALQMLNMSSCGLSWVTADVGLLQKLTQLDLSKNKIEYLPDELCNIISLRWLSLQDNTLSSLPEKIGNLLCLEYLDVSFNKLASIPESFRLLRSINKLKLSHCGCCQMTFLSEFSKLNVVQIDIWQLLSIPQHTLMQFHSKLLKLAISLVISVYEGAFEVHRIADCSIDIDKLKQGQLHLGSLNINRLSTPPPHFISGSLLTNHTIYMQSLIHLEASSSRVSTFFIDFLQHLDLSNNRLVVIPEAIYMFHNLTHLDISNNIITDLTENMFVLQNLSSLQHLDLSHNKLREIPEALSSLGNLTHLDVSNNIITALPRGLIALKEIESFYVNRNKISWERFIDLASYKKLKYVKFDLIDYPHLGNLPSSLISITVTLCDSQTNHIDDIDWDIKTSRKPHKYFDFVVRSLQGRTPATVTLSSSDMHTISPIVLALPQGSERVHSLLLSDNSISDVPSDTFKLSYLQRLDLSRNNISLIPGNLWKLPHLNYLDVSSNKIKEITEEISFARSLRTLLAQANELTELPQSLSTLPLLEELCVFSNDIDINRTPSLLSMMTLEHLKIDLENAVNCESHLTCSESLHMHCYYQNERVIVISAKIFFEHLTQISKLMQANDKQLSINLAGVGLVAFPRPIISQHLNVEAIDLSQNEIRDIPEEVCNLLEHLQKITLSQNDIQHFPQYLHLCNSLRHLNLYINAIQSLPDDIGEMKQLQYLNLSSNSLKRLPLSIGNLQQLEELILDSNQIEQLPDSIGKLEKLLILKLSANCLRAVPTLLCNLLCLRQIDLSNNSLESIPEMIGTLKNITSLDVRGNSLSILPSSLCSCQSLETIKLSSNMLSQLPDNIDQLENLTSLQASMNRLSIIPLSICRLQHLQSLDVSWNSITELPEKLGDLSGLVDLNVGSNHLKKLPESFTRLLNLTSLNISWNCLTTIPEEMFEFVNLTDLDIAGNQIDTLPNTICELQNLQNLNLENNKLTLLPNQFGQLKLLKFGKDQILGNPIKQPPIEVFEQGMEGVVAYFEELNLSKAIEVPRVKALLLGEVAAGKTSLCNAIRLGKSKLTDSTDRTAGIEVHPARLQDSIQVLMHDFGGHKIYHLTHQFFLSIAALYIIVVDLKAFKQSSFDTTIKYWLNVIKARIDSKPVLRIVGTHKDLCDLEEIKEKAESIMKKMKQIEKIEVESLKKHLLDIDHALNRAGLPCSDWCYSLEGFDTQSLRKRMKFIEHLIDNRPIFPEHIDLVSCDFSLDGVKQLIERIVISCQDHKLFPRRILPKSWFELELAIKTLKQGGQLRYLSMDNVRKIAKEKANMTPARLTQALKYLHDIGEIVHFSDSPQLSNFVFHKPQWLMDVFKLVYKPVDRFDERFASVSDADFDDMVEDFSSRGLVSEQMIQCLWKQMNLSKQDESMLICLLQKFDLCFQMPTAETADPYTTDSVSPVYRFPWLLKASAPRQFRQYWKRKISSDEEVLMVVFQLQNYCPVGLFETLSVKLDKYVICRKDWQNGLIAVSKVGENKILVQLEPKQRSEEIVISVRTQSKDLKEAWGVMVLLINATKELLQQWPGVLYCVRVVCPHCLKQGLDKPHRFSGAVLKKAQRGNVVCPKAMEKIDPRLIHPEISPAQWQQRRKRALEECGKSPAPEEIMMEKQPRYSEPDMSVRNSSTGHATDISKDCTAQGHADTDNIWDRFRSMSMEMLPGYEGRLTAHLKESGLTLRPDVPKDGNCLFHAVSDQLVRTGSQAISHSQLRREVVGYLRQHPHNEQGDHHRAFVPNEDWEGYLQQMSQDRVWGDHIVLQALASMLGRDIRIVSSIDADNYTTILSPMGNQQDTTGPPLLLGHYAENHYASLDTDSDRTKTHPPETSQPGAGPSGIIMRTEPRANGSGIKPVVLLIDDEYGNSNGGISTIHRQMAGMLVSKGAVVYSIVLDATKDDMDAAASDGVQLIFPTTHKGDKRKPSLDWLTWEHESHYPNLPSDIGFIVGHVNITSQAARQIKDQRLRDAKLVQVTHVIPEDTSHYKGDEKVMSIGEESDSILDDLQHADVIFSVGPYTYDYYKNQTRQMKPHYEFLPKPSDIFSKVQVKHTDTETKVVLSMGRVKGMERLKGYDLSVKAMVKVIDHLPNTKLRIRGVSPEDFPESKKVIQANVEKGKFNFTPLKYATQKELSKDIQKADVVLMPSRAEPFGLVGLEAIAAGVPVLVSHKSGLAWFLGSQDPEFDRVIVEISDDDDEAAETLAKRIIKILKDGRREFQAARRLKEKLLASNYWDASHRKFLETFGL